MAGKARAGCSKYLLLSWALMDTEKRKPPVTGRSQESGDQVPGAGSLSSKKPARLGHRERIPQLFPVAGEAPQSVAPPGLWFRKADLSNTRDVYKSQGEAVCSIPGGRE